MSRSVFVTGATGYIARHIVARLLDDGHRVIGSTRDLRREAELHEALGPALADPGSLDRLSLVALDLTEDAGWDHAMSGADALIHTASPYPFTQPRDAEALIEAAVGGTLRALRAARRACIGQVVLTSSTVAVTDPAGEKDVYSEADWTDPDKPGVTPYARSKTLAERAAWDWAGSEAPDLRLAVINPAFVIGPPLGESQGTSMRVVARLLRGRDPMLPRLGLPCCDVRDVAEAHLRALEAEGAGGHRHIVFDRFLWFSEIARLVREAVPGARASTRVAPDVLVRLMAIFDPAIRSIVPQLGRVTRADNTRMREILGLAPRDARESIRETARHIAALA